MLNEKEQEVEENLLDDVEWLLSENMDNLMDVLLVKDH
jgi:hypothetical protein